MMNKINKKISILLVYTLLVLSLVSCKNNVETAENIEATLETTETAIIDNDEIEKVEIGVDFSYPYASFSIINDGKSVLYRHKGQSNSENAYIVNYKNRRRIVAINAGHGTTGGSKIKTFSHPDFSPKVSGGTNAKGSILSQAVSDGTVLKNGIPEREANLIIANKVKEKLLDFGFDVLMIRDADDVRLDNIARTVIGNKNADIHIALHFDSTESDKGIFYISPIRNESYLNMEPVKSNYKNIDRLGTILVSTYRDLGEKIWKEPGYYKGDLTQIAFSTNPSVDLELGDTATILTDEKIESLSEGLKVGIVNYFLDDINQ